MSSYYTFNPPSHELICRHLNNKITEADEDLEIASEINEVNICNYEPAEISGLTKMQSTHTWHVISPVEKLRGNSQRTKRSTRSGHWKITGKDSDVKDFDGNIVGFKKYLIFKENRSSSSSSSSTTGGQHTNTTWTIHELHSSIQHPNKDAFVLCKLMKRTRAPRDNVVAEASAAVVEEDPNIFTSFETQSFVEDYGRGIFEELEDIVSVEIL